MSLNDTACKTLIIVCTLWFCVTLHASYQANLVLHKKVHQVQLISSATTKIHFVPDSCYHIVCVCWMVLHVKDCPLLVNLYVSVMIKQHSLVRLHARLHWIHIPHHFSLLLFAMLLLSCTPFLHAYVSLLITYCLYISFQISRRTCANY